MFPHCCGRSADERFFWGVLAHSEAGFRARL
jgi:hypothetical protein